MRYLRSLEVATAATCLVLMMTGAISAGHLDRRLRGTRVGRFLYDHAPEESIPSRKLRGSRNSTTPILSIHEGDIEDATGETPPVAPFGTATQENTTVTHNLFARVFPMGPTTVEQPEVSVPPVVTQTPPCEPTESEEGLDVAKPGCAAIRSNIEGHVAQASRVNEAYENGLLSKREAFFAVMGLKRHLHVAVRLCSDDARVQAALEEADRMFAELSTKLEPEPVDNREFEGEDSLDKFKAEAEAILGALDAGALTLSEAQEAFLRLRSRFVNFCVHVDSEATEELLEFFVETEVKLNLQQAVDNAIASTQFSKDELLEWLNSAIENVEGSTELSVEEIRENVFLKANRTVAEADGITQEQVDKVTAQLEELVKRLEEAKTETEVSKELLLQFMLDLKAGLVALQEDHLSNEEFEGIVSDARDKLFDNSMKVACYKRYALEKLLADIHAKCESTTDPEMQSICQLEIARCKEQMIMYPECPKVVKGRPEIIETVPEPTAALLQKLDAVWVGSTSDVYDLVEGMYKINAPQAAVEAVLDTVINEAEKNRSIGFRN